MGIKERDIINERLAGLGENERLFRANSGMGWAGKSTRKGDFLILKNPRPFHGMPEGFPDLVGWTTVEITPDMVGQRLAVFTAEEVKATGKLSPEQERFRDVIERMGGRWRVISHPIE
jgi:hypothetical protein